MVVCTAAGRAEIYEVETTKKEKQNNTFRTIGHLVTDCPGHPVRGPRERRNNIRRRRRRRFSSRAHTPTTDDHRQWPRARETENNKVPGRADHCPSRIQRGRRASLKSRAVIIYLQEKKKKERPFFFLLLFFDSGKKTKRARPYRGVCKAWSLFFFCFFFYRRQNKAEGILFGYH